MRLENLLKANAPRKHFKGKMRLEDFKGKMHLEIIKGKMRLENSLKAEYMVALKVIMNLILEVMVLKPCNQKE